MATDAAFEYFQIAAALSRRSSRAVLKWQGAPFEESLPGPRLESGRSRGDAASGGATRSIRRDCASCALSPVYETEPMDVPGQRWFLNLVAEAETDLFPLQLLHRTSQNRAQLGRRRTGAQRAADHRHRYPAVRQCGGEDAESRNSASAFSRPAALCWRRWRTWLRTCATPSPERPCAKCSANSTGKLFAELPPNNGKSPPILAKPIRIKSNREL